MQLVVGPDGSVRCLYGEVIDLAELGALQIRRASLVEPTADGKWLADLSPTAGPSLGPFNLRSEALDAEREWLEANWLMNCDSR
jgi:hypothetical protein